MSQDNPPPPPQEPYGQPATSDDWQPSRGFFGALFDFSFEHFVTPMIVKTFYALAIVGLGIVWVFQVVSASSESPAFAMVILLLGPLLIVLYLCLIRMTLELFIAVTRMSQDIHHRLR